jgi:hypothetical protein
MQRNDKCWCGSGKKYKHCCLKTAYDVGEAAFDKYQDGKYIKFTINLLKTIPGITDIFIPDCVSKMKYYRVEFSNRSEILVVQNGPKTIFLQPVGCKATELINAVKIANDGTVFGDKTKFKSAMYLLPEAIQEKGFQINIFKGGNVCFPIMDTTKGLN